jgi:hypothetical protein
MEKQDTPEQQDRHEQAGANGVPSYVGSDGSKMTLDVAVRPVL